MINQLQTYCESRLDETLEFLRQMVAINSFTANAAGVDRLGRFVAEKFAALGFTASHVKAAQADFGHHLVLQRKCGTGARSVALVSHLDTVFPEEEERRHDFQWRLEGTRIHGPGTNDIKGGTALIHLTLEALRATDPALFEETSWYVLLNACEEVASGDFGALCRSVVPENARACLVFEADGGREEAFSLVTARKGRSTYRVIVTGRGAHAGGQHRRGANAIAQLAEVIQDVSRLTDYDQALTVNVGAVSGGTVTNRVPHAAIGELEMRAFDMEVYERAKSHILAWNREGAIGSVEDPFRCRVAVELLDETVPWPRNAATDALFAQWEAAGRGLGFTVGREERGGLSDGNVLWETYPTLDGLGPRGGGAHCSEKNVAEGKEQEWVDLRSFVPKAILNVTALTKILL